MTKKRVLRDVRASVCLTGDLMWCKALSVVLLAVVDS